MFCWGPRSIRHRSTCGTSRRHRHQAAFLRCLVVRVNVNVFVSAGASAVYSMRWLRAGHSSLAPPWRTSSTSSSGYWVSEGRAALRLTPRARLLHICSVTPGTPTEGNWPGISSIEEFKSYNFPKYKPQPIINHAPRCVCVFICVTGNPMERLHRQRSVSFLIRTPACSHQPLPHRQ